MATKTLQPKDIGPEEPRGPSTPANGVAAKPAPPSLTPEQIAIVKSTAPVLQEHGVTITTLFYNNMLAAHPELKNVFSVTSQATGAQPRALAASVLAYATYIDDLGKLHHAVERIAHKHASLQIQPDQYDIVGKHLMEAIGQVLGDAATPAIVDAWTNAYAVLASVFINREQGLYKEAREADDNNGHGWVGWRKFRVAKREAANASAQILNLYLEPVDGKPLPSFLPGQYVSLQLFIPELGVLQSRQYSLSQAPPAAKTGGDHYRISVKRDEGSKPGKPGLLSNLLHAKVQVGDEVELSQPQGEFVLDADVASDEEKGPVALISAGVGATPVLAILEQLSTASNRPVSWLHGSHSEATLPFVNTVRKLQEAHPGQIKTRFVLTDAAAPPDAALASSSPDQEVVVGQRLDVSNLSEADRAAQLFLGNSKAGYYVCGPAQFMLDTRKALEELGVSADRIHLELFATGDL